MSIVTEVPQKNTPASPALGTQRITNTYHHSINDGIEQYAFPSALNSKQTHFVDRVDGGPWGLSVVNHAESLSIDEGRTLAAEVTDLCNFMAKLIEADQQEATK